jgi:hypothetical protein
MLATGALVLALVASSVANAGRASLRCVDGQLLAFRGSLMPAGEEPLDDPSLPPLPVPSAACEDEELEDLAALRARHREIARSRVDEVMRSEDRLAIESTMEALDAMAEPAAGDEGEEVLHERRALLQSIVDAKVQEARDAQQDALRWIERARNTGVDPAHLRAAERSLDLPAVEPEAPPLRPVDAALVPAPDMLEPAPDGLDLAAPRSL